MRRRRVSVEFVEECVVSLTRAQAAVGPEDRIAGASAVLAKDAGEDDLAVAAVFGAPLTRLLPERRHIREVDLRHLEVVRQAVREAIAHYAAGNGSLAFSRMAHAGF